VEIDVIVTGREVEVVLDEVEMENADVVVVVWDGIESISYTSSQYLNWLSFPT